MSSAIDQLITPLRGLVNFFSPPVPSIVLASTSMPLKLAKPPALPSARPTKAAVRTQTVGMRLVDPSLLGQIPSRAHTLAAPAASASASASHVLRSRRAQDGRIVIAGRFSDVCAELDRLCQEPA
jgi:hypothetical protein